MPEAVAAVETVPTLPTASTFAAELKQVRRSSNTEKAQATVDPVASPAPVEVASTASKPELEIPPTLETSFDLVDPEAPPKAAAVAKAEPKVEPPAAPAESKKAIKIGDRSFDKVEEALEYAKELERAATADKAYIEGVKDATKKPVEEAAPQETPYEKFAKRIFEDPVAAAKEYADDIKQDIVNLYNNSIKQQNEAEAQASYNNSIKQQNEAEAQARQRNEAYDTFYKTNPDLSTPAVRKIVDRLMTEKWNELGPLSPDVAWPKLALYARNEVKAITEGAVPTKEMPSGPVVTTGSSGMEAPVTTEEKPQENLDFVRQLNQFRKGKRK